MKNLLIINMVVAVMLASAMPLSLEKRRFGQEQPPQLQKVRDLAKLPNVPPNGRFDQIAGGFISTLLAATDACARYALIDEIVTLSKSTGNGAQGISVARELASVEKNFNPFAGAAAKPAFCTNAALPASPEVRCIVPVIDPGFAGAAAFNAKANARLQQVQSGQLTPQSCAGQSVAQQAVALGLADCVGCNVAVAPTGNQNVNTQNNQSIKQVDNRAIGNGQNINKFTGALGGAAPIKVRNVGGARPFQVILANGNLNGDFLNAGAALQRACDVQHNDCARIGNSAKGRELRVTVAACDAQRKQCVAVNGL